MSIRQRNQYIQTEVKREVLDNPTYVQTRKKVLMLTLIPAAFLVIDRIIAIAQGVLMTSGAFQVFYGVFMMTLAIFCAVNADTVFTAVWLFLCAILSAFVLVSQFAAFGIESVSIGLLVFYFLYILVFIVVGILLLADPQIQSYHAHAKKIKQRARAEAKTM